MINEKRERGGADIRVSQKRKVGPDHIIDKARYLRSRG